MGSKHQTWRGYYPIAGFVLEALTKKSRGHESVEFTHAERVLFIASDFLAAAAQRRLEGYLAVNRVQMLRTALPAFEEIGAVRVVSILRVAIGELTNRSAVLNAEQVTADVEDQVLHTEDSLDDLIARYAARELGDNGVQV